MIQLTNKIAKFLYWTLIITVLLFIFTRCDEPKDEPKPDPIVKVIDRDSLINTALYNINVSKIEAHGLIKPLNPGFYFPGTKDSYINLPNFSPSNFQGGITIYAVVQFDTDESYTRIVDLGNGRGEDQGYNITLSRGQTPDNIILTSWTDTTNVNRGEGRLIAQNLVHSGQTYTIAGVIDETGYFKIYVDGNLKAEGERNRIIPTDRIMNYVGKSNWDLDPLFEGSMIELMIFGNDLDVEYLGVLK